MYNFQPIDCYSKARNRRKGVVGIGPDGKKQSFPTVREAGRQVGVPSPNIVACLQGRLKTAGGYRWEYADTWKTETF